MDRRRFLTRSATLVAAAATVATPAIAKGVRELKMVTSWPKGFPGVGTSAERLGRSITALTGGRLKVQVFAAEELVKPLEVFDAVSAGVADMYHSADYYWEKQSPAFGFFAAVPFGFTADEMAAWINWGGGQALWDELGGQGAAGAQCRCADGRLVHQGGEGSGKLCGTAVPNAGSRRGGAATTGCDRCQPAGRRDRGCAALEETWMSALA